MKISKIIFLFSLLTGFYQNSSAQQLIVGAEQLDAYLPLLKNQKVALVVNQTSLVGDQHLVDVLQKKKVKIEKVFAPEHGFRGEADAGEKVKSGKDKKSGLPIVSLYGDNKKPTAEQLKDIDVLVFDIQDVGVRFYTYISTMHYVMEAAAENNKKVIILDRPNPNGDYVDGPILDPSQKSFVGMHPIPIVHGLTVGELAKMINGEGWLAGKKKCQLTVIPVQGYTHSMHYSLPVKPSPNLPNDLSIRLYPSICLFEGTNISVGRGTDFPFQVIGAPNNKLGSFTFTPQSTPGAKNPPFLAKTCYGLDLRNEGLDHRFTLKYVIDFFQKLQQPKDFFLPFFHKLAGTSELMTQIKVGIEEEDIRVTWGESLNAYKAMRKKYLLYPDFE